jgi:hypothetical protein
LGICFSGGVGRHGAIAFVERRVHDVGSQKIFNELAYLAFADGSVQTIVNSLVQSNGHSLVHNGYFMRYALNAQRGLRMQGLQAFRKRWSMAIKGSAFWRTSP